MLDNCDKSVISSSTNPWPQIDVTSSTTSHINQLLYGLPSNPSFTNFPFQRFNSRNSNGETLPTSCNGYNQQLSALGLNFPSSSASTMSRDEHEYGGGFNHNSHIQDLLTSSNSILSNLSLLGSSSSTYATNASLIASSLQKQKQVWNGLRETRPSSNYQTLLPFENLQMGGHGDASMVMDLVKMEEGKDRNRAPYENHMEPIGSSDSSLYWNSTSAGAWSDLANYGSSVTPLI
ncbi:hypothetical protein IFM89_023366 [Coptis chinensis]|uniref:Uncharacterized protein n=1 Tax=Coptis chinensis TaxID=261450 RepID=A0A835I6I0_9MAGN|nr:hypothetical protein IFM89_023366 [Coptis chinensis]